MAEQEKTIQTIYGEQTERDVIRTLVGELEHINKLFKWQMDQSTKMRKALQKWDALIQYQYNGSREAMSALQECAFETDAILKGYTLGEKE